MGAGEGDGGRWGLASAREIAARLGINRRTVRRLIEAPESPRYERAPTGSMLDPLEPVMRALIEDFGGIKAPRVAEVLRRAIDRDPAIKTLVLNRPGGSDERPPEAGAGECSLSALTKLLQLLARALPQLLGQKALERVLQVPFALVQLSVRPTLADRLQHPFVRVADDSFGLALK